MSDSPTTGDTWVYTTEASEITGYNPDYLTQLARKMWKKPEQEREIKVRNRSRRYEMWLPDLIKYMSEHGNGPQIHPPKS
jgi:hypothetical protein